MSAMQRICRWLMDHAGLILLLQLLLTGMFIWQFRNLRYDTSPSTLILSGSPEHQYYKKIAKVFGSDQLVLVGITGEDMLQPKQLKAIRDMTNELQRISGVKQVLSLTNVTDVQGGKDEVLVAPLIPEDLQSVSREALQKRLKINPFYYRNLISTDGRTCSLVIFLEDSDDQNGLVQVREVTRKINAVAEAMQGANQVFLGGLPQMELQGTENMIRDLWLFTPITLFLVVTILLITFRCLRGILLPMGVIGLTLIWTLGAMVWSGRPMKVTTLILPSLLIANGCSYVIHFLAQYYHALIRSYAKGSTHGVERLDKEMYQASMLEALGIVHRPIFISAATTMAGFGALALNRIPAIQDLGIFATVGILLSYFFCMTLVPCVLILLPIPRLHQLPGKEGSHRHVFLEKLGSFNIHHRRWVWAISLACAGWALWGLFRLQVYTDYLGYFRSSAPVVQAAKEFQKRLAGIAPLSVIVEATGQRAVTEPDILKVAEALQESLGQAPAVDLTLSFVDILKMLNRAFHDEDPNYFKLPTDPAIINDLIDFTESDPTRLSEGFISSDRKSLRIFARTHLFSSTEFRHELDRLKQASVTLVPADVRVHATGTLVLMNQTSDQVAKEQVKSLVISVSTIALIVIVLFRSWKIGLMALIPAALPVFLCFGLMGWSGTPLNVNTSLVANIAIGIAVNNCVHYIIHFRRNLSKGLSIQDSTRESLNNAGGPMLATSIALTLAFLVFGLSRFVPVAHFGLLSAFIMGMDLVANIFLLPSLMLSQRLWNR
jgi:predicted RND superfamily exporter protein